MDWNKLSQKLQILYFQSLLIVGSQNTLHKSFSVRSGGDSDLSSLSDQPRVFITKGDIVCQVKNVWEFSFNRFVSELFESRPQEAEEPHHSKKVSGGWVVFFPLFRGFFRLVIVTIVNLDILGHFHLDKAKEAMMVGEDFIVAPDDSGFFSNVRKSYTQDRAHFWK